MDTTSEKLAKLIEYVKSEGRICPMPMFWNDFYEMLPDKKRVGDKWEPPTPMILGAWHGTPGFIKQLIFITQIEYAASHNFLNKADNYLRSLTEDQWFK